MTLDPLAPVRLTTAYFILFCIVLHLFTGVNLLMFPDSAGSTTVSTPIELFGTPGRAGTAYILAGVMALFAMRLPYPHNIFMLMPQQAMLISATIGILLSVWAGSFADGVVRPRPFLWQDHCELPLICLFHGGVLMMRAALSSRMGPGLFYHPLEKAGI